MTGIPGVQAFLDDGSGTYTLDISDRLEESLSISSYGRTDEFSQAQAAQLQLTLDNSDGALSTGGGFGVLPFGWGGFGGVGGLLSKGMPIRIRLTKGATTRDRFTGKIIGADLGWPGGSGAYAQVTVSAMDILSDLAAVELRSMLEEEILLDSPATYYTLGEAAGSTSAGDTSGHQAPALISAGTGAPVVFGNGAAFAGGQHLQGSTASGLLGTGAWSFEFLVSSPAPAPFISVLDVRATNIALPDYAVTTTLLVDGRLRVQSGLGFYNLTTTGSVCDGLVHHIAVTWDGATASLYLDGSLAATDAATNFGVVLTDVYIGNDVTGFNPFTGSVSHVAFYSSALSAARVAAHADGRTGFAGETTTERFERLASYAGVATATTTGMSGQTMGVQATAGVKLLDALEEVTTAEGGFLYADGSGTIVLQGRGYRAGKTVADLSLAAEELASDTGVTLDNQQQVTLVTVNRAGGATQVAGVRTPGIEDASLDLAIDNDGDALRAAQWLVAKHSDPGPRLGTGTFAVLNSTSSEGLLGLEIGDRLAFTGMPDQMWEEFGDVTVEGWTESIAIDTWTLQANLLPWSLFTALVLDDPVYGALDAFPIAN